MLCAVKVVMQYSVITALLIFFITLDTQSSRTGIKSPNTSLYTSLHTTFTYSLLPKLLGNGCPSQESLRFDSPNQPHYHTYIAHKQTITSQNASKTLSVYQNSNKYLLLIYLFVLFIVSF